MNRNTARPPGEEGPPYPHFLTEGRGNCATYPRPDHFTATNKTAAGRRNLQRAATVCLGCPFRYPCANWAAENDQEGIYGGTTQSERRRDA